MKHPRRARSLLTQVAWLTIIAMILAQVAGYWLFTAERATAIRTKQRSEAIERTIRLARLLDSKPLVLRDSLVEAATSTALGFDVALQASVVGSGTDLATEWPGSRSREYVITPHGRLRPPPGLQWLREAMMKAGLAPVELRLSLPLANGDWLNSKARLERPGLQLPPQIVASTLLTVTLLVGALWLGLRRITRPLRELVGAADQMELETDLPKMPEGGPREVRALSEALARMHARLSQMIGERTQMLAALGHDLRSPITALRVRAEMVDDDETRERILTSLDEMQEMTEATLAYARGVSVAEPVEEVDLAALLGELAQELSTIGPPVEITAAEPAVLPLRRVAMRRALRNLLENAQRYGGGAAATLSRKGEMVEIVIDDNGPGIPEADLERVFNPFDRLETSRSRDTGGVGLGLPIARSILRAHGGDVSLSNRAEGGLRTLVRLPLSTGHIRDKKHHAD
ncbi:ATP-binding protein [uncultured Roseibium sp.]|uniref:ATP-binding protein n=1 Tax=uncultured Roseibium sp. TaxID=1936171 RepID=UPI003216B65A